MTITGNGYVTVTQLNKMCHNNENPFPGSKRVKTICTICSAGCGIIAEVQNGVWIRQDVAQDHPISQGSHCCKGIDQIDLIKSKQRVKYPLKKENGKWQRISWEIGRAHV